ncbi:hypothetical protein BYT27DRAFT_7127331 [Phlegmacium glaucopus]|nr:hypothetical protein BYT27DRAFT_7127331 [Phlegmacium glaucopus]
MSIETGQYNIVNVWQHNLAHLPASNDGTPLAGNPEKNDLKERWNVKNLGNGNYTVKSASNNMFAFAGNRAREGAVIKGSSSSQEWVIKETRVQGQFSIIASDTGLFWGLVDDRTGTPVALASTVSDCRNAWYFQKRTEYKEVKVDVKPPPKTYVQPQAPPPGYYNPAGGEEFGPNVPIPTWR